MPRVGNSFRTVPNDAQRSTGSCDLVIDAESTACTAVLSFTLCAYFLSKHSLLKDIQEQLADGGSSKSVQSALQQSESSAAWQQLMKPIKLTCATVGSKGASNMVSNETYTAAVIHM
jgi:hypothetical protein